MKMRVRVRAREVVYVMKTAVRGRERDALSGELLDHVA